METIQLPFASSTFIIAGRPGRVQLLLQAAFLLVATVLLGLAPLASYGQSQFVSNIVNTNGASSTSNGSQSGIRFGHNYYTNSPGSTLGATPFDTGTNSYNYLGTFNRNTPPTDTLGINASSTISAAGGQSITDVQLLYRVFRKDNFTAGMQQGFAPLTLNLASGDPAGTSTWTVTGNSLDLLSNINSPGEYIVQLYFQASATDPSNPSTPATITDSNNGSNYSAQFYVFVNSSSFVSIAYTGTSSPDGNWFNPNNWTDANGNHFTPNKNTDVEIPFIENIPNYPIIGGTNKAEVHNLVIDANPDAADPTLPGARLTLNSSVLQVSGLFQDLNLASSFAQFGGRLVLNGRDQIFDASNPTLRTFEITGGGTKRFTSGLTVINSLSFIPNADGSAAGIVVLPAARNIVNEITLRSTASIGTESMSGSGVYVNGETDGAYIQGVITSNRNVAQNSSSSFGNLGIELTPTSNAPGNVTVRRTYSIYKGPNNSVSVRRGFSFTNADNPITNYNLKFSYLTAVLNGIQPANLTLFQSGSGSAPFTPLGRDNVNQANKTVTKANIGVNLLATFTLGDITRPLPVTLASFTATGTAQGAVLRWITASELNNKGFGVERQLVGSATWQSVGYVDGTNAANGSTYNFLDKTIPAGATQVYYRLRQEDKTGELTYSPVAAISRAAAEAALTLSPVPLDNSPLLVSFAEAGQAGAVIEVVNMQGQRVGHFAADGSTEGSVSLQLGHLAAGVYIVNVQVPGQATRHARFVKQ